MPLRQPFFAIQRRYGMKTFLTQDQLVEHLSRCNYPSKLKDSLQSSLLAVELIRNNVDNAIAALMLVESDEEMVLVRSKNNLADILTKLGGGKRKIPIHNY